MSAKGSYKIRFTKEEIETRLSAGQTRQQIAKDLGMAATSLGYHLNKLGIPRLKDNEWARKYKPFNPDGFRTLDNEVYAYWTGFIAADGCVHVSGGKASVSLHTKLDDLKHIERFKKDLELEQPIGRGATSNGYNDKLHPFCDIHIQSMALVNTLAKWNITPRKSLTIQWPDNLPEKALPHFIRGYFDGNGTIYNRHRHGPKTGIAWHETVCRFISGSPDFLNSLERVLNNQGIVTNKQYKNGETNAYVLPLSGRIANLNLFGSFIYQNSSVWLDRKKDYFDLLLEKVA